MKKIFLFLIIISCTLLSGCNNDIGIIGGSDGPTKIIVSKITSQKEPVRMIMAKGNLYYDTDEESDITPRCGTLDSEFTGRVDKFEIPQKDGEANFKGIGWQLGMAEDTIEVPIEDDWQIFRRIDTNSDIFKYKYCYILEGRLPNAADDSEFLVLSNDLSTTFEEAAYVLLGADISKMKDIYVLPITD